MWLSACLLIHTVDTECAQNMIQRYEQDENKFEWMGLFKRNKKKRKNMETYTKSNLYDQLLQTKDNKYQVQRVTLCKDYVSENITKLIVEEVQEGMFVAILMDKNGVMSHAVGIHAGKN